MSGEAFDTHFVEDARTNEDGKGEYGIAYSQVPRAIEYGRFTADRAHGWVAVHAYAERLVQVAAEAVRTQEMRGLSGDHPEKREWLADELERLAGLVRMLALDHACDAHVTDQSWAEAGGGCIGNIDASIPADKLFTGLHDANGACSGWSE